MKTSFFEQFPTQRDLAKYLRSKPETAGISTVAFITDNLPREGAFQTEIVKAIERWKKEQRISPSAFLWKHGAGVYNRNGLPDLMMVCDGQFFAFEIKRPYVGKPTRLQTKAVVIINAAGGHADVVTYPSEVKAMLIKAGVWRDEI